MVWHGYWGSSLAVRRPENGGQHAAVARVTRVSEKVQDDHCLEHIKGVAVLTRKRAWGSIDGMTIAAKADTYDVCSSEQCSHPRYAASDVPNGHCCSNSTAKQHCLRASRTQQDWQQPNIQHTSLKR